MPDYLSKLFGLTGKKAVVIGGTGVLCGQMSQALAKAGAEVVVAGRSREKGDARVQAIADEGGQARFLPVDASSRDSIQALCDAATNLLGHVDILINGAGKNSATSYFEIPDHEWDEIFSTNVRSVHQACQIFGKQMAKRQSGSIINVASISTPVPLSRVFAYAASKAAVVNYTLNLARELGPAGVRVNCISRAFFPQSKIARSSMRSASPRSSGELPSRALASPMSSTLRSCYLLPATREHS